MITPKELKEAAEGILIESLMMIFVTMLKWNKLWSPQHEKEMNLLKQV